MSSAALGQGATRAALLAALGQGATRAALLAALGQGPLAESLRALRAASLVRSEAEAYQQLERSLARRRGEIP